MVCQRRLRLAACILEASWAGIRSTRADCVNPWHRRHQCESKVFAYLGDRHLRDAWREQVSPRRDRAHMVSCILEHLEHVILPWLEEEVERPVRGGMEVLPREHGAPGLGAHGSLGEAVCAELGVSATEAGPSSAGGSLLKRVPSLASWSKWGVLITGLPVQPSES